MSWGYYRTQNNGSSSRTVYVPDHLGMVVSSSPAWCIFSKAVLLKKVSFVRKDRQTDRRTEGQMDRRTDGQTNILNHVVKTSRSANLRLPRGKYT